MLLNKLSLYHEGKFDIYTNGLLFTKEFYDFLGKLPNKVCVLFSYHFYNFDGKENNYLPAQVELLRSLETPHPNVELVFVTHETKYTDPEKLKQWKEFWESIATMSKTISAVHINPHINKWGGKMEDGNTGFSGCPYSDGAHFFVGVTGNVLPCCIDLEEELILGNILTDDMEKLMEDRRYFYEETHTPAERRDLCNRCICE
jgi:radical SAM protein with 4Fe4S-binding SPASM domain